MTRPLRLLPVLLALAACTGPSEAPATAAQREAAEAENLALSTRLQETIRGAGVVGPCAAVVPGEWPAGFPVPVEASGGRRFKIFFYPMTGTPGAAPKFASPAAEALLDLDMGKAASCALTPETPKEMTGNRWPAALEGVGAFPHQALIEKLYDRTEAVAAVYASKAPTPAGVETAKDYIRLFKLNAEPPLLPYYYRLNPAFWEWLRATAGDSIPPAP